MAADQQFGQKTRWWSSIRKTLTADFHANHAHYRYPQAYGWAQARLGLASGLCQKTIRNMAVFFDDERTDHAWDWYRIEFLMHKPFSMPATWEQVAGRLSDILEDPALIVQFIRIRDNGNVDKTNWCKASHACNFILSLLYERIKYEDGLANKQTAATGATTTSNVNSNDNSAWTPCDRWAAAHVLYSMLCGFQDEFARGYKDRNHNRYVTEYKSAEADGGVNPVVLPDDPKMTPDQYMAQLIASDNSLAGRIGSYFKAMP